MPSTGVDRRVGPAEFARLLDKAALAAIEDQNHAGIDIMTDGEERRGHYVLHIVNKLDGIDARNRKPHFHARRERQSRTRRGSSARSSTTGPWFSTSSCSRSEHAKGIAKIGLPGPSTVADCVADEYYGGDRKQLAFDYADAIHHEVEALIEAGCEMIQFDDPVLLRYPAAAQAWGLQALERCFAGPRGPRDVRRAYLPRLSEQAAGAQRHPLQGEPGLLPRYPDLAVRVQARRRFDRGGGKQAGCLRIERDRQQNRHAGRLDVGENEVESVESLVARANEALRHIPIGQLILAPDCGMLELTRASARQKLVNLSLAARAVNGP